MADEEVSVRISAQSDVEAGMQAAGQAVHAAAQTINTSFAQLSAAIQQFNGNLNQATQALGANAQAQRTTAAATQGTAAAATQATTAQAGLAAATAGATTQAQAAAGAMQGAAVAVNQVGAAASTASGHIGVGATAMREFIVLGHELVTGNFSRIPGSLLVLGERLNGLGTIVNLVTGAWGPFIVAGIAAVAGLAYIAYQAYETNQALKELQGGLQFSGGTESAKDISDAYQKLQEAFHLSNNEAREVAVSMSHLTGVARGYWEQLGEVAAAQARVEHSDIKKSLEEVYRAAESGAKGLLEYADKHRLVDANQKATFEAMIKGGRDIQAFQGILEDVIGAIDRHGGALERDKAQMDNWIDSARNMVLVGGEAAGALTSQLPAPPTPGTPAPGGAPAHGSGIAPGAMAAADKGMADLIASGKRPPGMPPGDPAEVMRQQTENATHLNKADQERAALQARIKTTSEAITDLLAQQSLADAGDADQKRISAALDTQRKAQNEAIIELAKIHSASERDSHKAIIAQLEAQKEGLHTAQDKLAIDKQIQAENVKFAGATPGAKAEGAKGIAASQKAADAEALRSHLISLEMMAAGDRHNDELKMQSAKAELAAIGAAEGESSIAYQHEQLKITNLESEQRDKAYRRFAETERLKIQEAKGSLSAQAAEYDKWLGQIVAVYHQDQAEYERVQREKVKAAQTAGAQSFSEQMRLIGNLGQIYNLESQAFSRAMKQMVDERKITTTQMDGFIEQEVAKNIDAQVKILQSIKATGNQTEEQQREIQAKILVLEEQKAEKIAALNEKIAAANKAALQKQLADYTQFANSVGSEIRTFIEAALLRTETRAKAMTQLLDNLSKSGLKLVGDLLSQGAAKAGAGLLNIQLEPGAGLTQLFTQGIQKLLGIGTQGVAATAQTTLMTTAITTAGTAQVTATEVAAVQIVAAIQAAGITQALAPKPFGFLGGGIVPSAAGGMVVGGTQLSLLHSKEMVLPERLSTGIQGAINSGNFSGGINNPTNTANLTYAPVFQGGAPFMTRGALEATLRSHGDTLVGYAQNLIRNGWRP